MFTDRETKQRLAGPILLGQLGHRPRSRASSPTTSNGLGAHKAWKVLQIPANALTQAKLLGPRSTRYDGAHLGGDGSGRGLGDLARQARHWRAADREGHHRARGRGASRVSAQAGCLKTLDPRRWRGTRRPISSSRAADASSRVSDQSVDGEVRGQPAPAPRSLHPPTAKTAATETFIAALRLSPAVEVAAWPVLGWLVPVVKAGAMVSAD